MRYDENVKKLCSEIQEAFAANKIGYDVQIGYLMLMGNVIFIDGTVVLHPQPSGLLEVNLLRYDVDPIIPPIKQVGVDGQLQFDLTSALNLALHEVEAAGNQFPLHTGFARCGCDFGTA